MPRDPYHDFEKDIENSLRRAESLFQKSSRDDKARRELSTTLDSLRQDLDDVKETVQVVEQSDASRFGIDAVELDRRKRFVQKCESTIHRLSSHLTSVMAQPSVSLAWEKEQQQQLLAHQDQALDTIGSSLYTLREQAQLIGQEADEHVLMLGELDTDVDRTQSQLQHAMVRMDKLIAQTDARLGGWCVWILIVARTRRN